MRVISGMLAVLLMSWGLALAGEGYKRGTYLGGALGTTQLNDDGALYGLSYDNQDSGAELWGGYRFLSWFAVEGKYAYLGQYTISNGFGSTNAKAYALTVNAVFILPFGQSDWDMYGQLGLGSLAYNFNSSSGTNDGSQTTGTAGFGVRWTPISTMTLSLGIDAYAWQEDGYYQSYNPSIAITKLGVQYNF
jgi:hypothetical protein